jgi:phosphoglycerol transferase
MHFNQSKIFTSIVQYLIAGTLSLVLFVLITHAWRFSLSVPFFYSGDSISFSAQLKSIADTGWYLLNPYIGSPGGFNFYDYPVSPDNFHYLLFKLMFLFTHNYAVVLNLFYLFTFPAATLSALLVLKRLGLRYPFALAGSLLFALLPYHFIRGQVGHLLLASYYVIPLATWLCVLIANNQILPFTRGHYQQWILYFLLCLLIGSSGFYYGVFSVIFLLISGLVASTQSKKLTSIWQALFLSFCILSTLGFNMVETFKYRAEYGTNKAILDRAPGESEYYGLKLTQLVFPLDNNRVQSLAQFKNSYNSSSPLVTHENGSATLGVLGSIGFLILLSVLLLGWNISREVTFLSKLNLSAVLLATVGGFGSMLAYTVSPLLRCYARISVFIAFFSLFAFFCLLQKISDRYSFLRTPVLAWGLIFCMIGIGVFSQTNSTFKNIQDPALVANFRSDANFVDKLEKSLPKSSMIYQLPYVPFPENPAVVSMKDYDHFRPYLHSHDLHWSYGALKGRPVANWLEGISHLPLSEMIKHIGYAGYNGIYINRNGYTDHGQKIEKELSSLLKVKPLISEDNNSSFFDLQPFALSLKEKESSSVWEKHLLDEAPDKTSLSWGQGFYALEQADKVEWHWSDKKGVLILVNYDTKPVQAKLLFKALTADKSISTLRIKSSLLTTQLQVNSDGTTFEKNISIPTGQHKIYFYAEGHQVIAPADPRRLFFRIENLLVQIMKV